MKEMLKQRSGFTLAELLIVIAIIAVLVSVMFPVFGGQLEVSRETADLANVRSAYGEVAMSALMYDELAGCYKGEDKWSITVPLTQRENRWQRSTPINVAGIVSGANGDSNTEGTWLGLPKALGTCEVVYHLTNGPVLIWDGELGGGGGTVDPGPNPGPVTPDPPDPPVIPDPPDPPDPPSGGGGVTVTGTPIDSDYKGQLSQGTVYFIDNKNYIFCWTDRNLDEQNRLWGQSNGEGFIEFPSNPVILTADNKFVWGSAQYIPAKKGNLFYDGSNYYMCVHDNEYWIPPVQDYTGDWVKVNPEQVTINQ